MCSVSISSSFLSSRESALSELEEVWRAFEGRLAYVLIMVEPPAEGRGIRDCNYIFVRTTVVYIINAKQLPLAPASLLCPVHGHFPSQYHAKLSVLLFLSLISCCDFAPP